MKSLKKGHYYAVKLLVNVLTIGILLVGGIFLMNLPVSNFPRLDPVEGLGGAILLMLLVPLLTVLNYANLHGDYVLCAAEQARLELEWEMTQSIPSRNLEVITTIEAGFIFQSFSIKSKLE